MKSATKAVPSVQRPFAMASMLSAGLLALVAGGARGADDQTLLKHMTLESLMEVQVSTMSRVDERVDEAPGSVYVFTREQIQQRGYRSLGELLQIVPGFTVFHRDLGFVAGVRGLNANDNEKITLLINGQNLNGVSEPDFLNGPINLDNVERVEVVVGPSSLFQPANTLAATINVITKDINGTEVVAGTGNATPYSATLMTGKQWAPDKSVSFSLTMEEKKGFHAWLDQPPRGRLYLDDKTGELEFPSFFSVLKGQAGELSAQVTAYRMVSSELNIDEQNPANDGRTVDQFYSVLLKDQHAWSPDLTSVASLDGTYKNKSRLEDSNSTTNGIEIVASDLDFTADLSLRYTGCEGHLIQAGVQGGYVHNFDTYAIVSYPPVAIIPKTTLVDADSHSVGAYADDEYRVTKWLKLVGGIRVDHNNVLRNDEGYPGARAAIIVEPLSNWVSKLTYNRAVRMPTALESPLDTAWGTGVPNAPFFTTNSPNATQPEILTTYEWQNIVYLGPLRLGVTVYHQELEDFIGWYNPWTNIGDFSGNGAEVNVQAQLDPSVNLWANGSWNNSRLHPFLSGPAGANMIFPVNVQGQIIGAPEYTANAGLDLKLTKNLSFSPAVRYFTDQAASDGGNLLTIRNRAYLDAGLLWRNCWRSNSGAELDLRLTGSNLTDNREPVAAQWRSQTYEPRGIDVMLSADLRF